MIPVLKTMGRSSLRCWKKPFSINISRPSKCSISSDTSDKTSSAAASKADNNQHLEESDSEDAHIKSALQVVTTNVAHPTSVEMVPGKGPPPEPPVDCCMSGCANCVWIQYAEELTRYFSSDSKEKVKKALEQIENPGLRMFIQLELGLL